MSNGIKTPSMFVVLFATALYLVYAPLFHLNFGYHNDYRIWEYSHRQFSIYGYPESIHLFVIGRWLGALLTNLQLLFFSGVDSLANGRLLNFFSILALFAVLYRFMSQNLNLDRLFSAGLCFSIFTLPPIQMAVLSILNLVPGISPLFLVAVSYWLFDKAAVRGVADLSDPIKLGTTIGAAFLFLMSFYIYPPMSMFFLVLTYLKFVFLKNISWMDLRRHLVSEAIFVVSVSIIYFASVKLMIATIFLKSTELAKQIMSLKTYESSAYGFNLDFAFDLKIQQLFQILKTSGQLWYVSGEGFWTLYFSLFLLFAAAFLSHRRFLEKTSHQTNRFYSIEILAAAIGIPLLTCAPLLLPKSNILLGYRMLFPISAILVIALFFSIKEVFSKSHSFKRVHFAVLGLSLIACVLASRNLFDVSLNLNSEYEFVRRELLNNLDTSSKEIQVLLLPAKSTITNAPLSLDFRNIATAEAFMAGLINTILDEFGGPSYHERIEVGFVQNQPEFSQTKKLGRFILDMRNAAYQVRLAANRHIDFMTNSSKCGIENLSPIEVQSNGSPSLRWGLGPQTSLLCFFAPASEVDLSFEFGNFIFPSDIEVQLEINGIPIKKYLARNGVLISDKVSFRPVFGKNEIVFKYSEWLHRAPAVTSSDPRKLSIMFFEIVSRVR